MSGRGGAAGRKRMKLDGGCPQASRNQGDGRLHGRKDVIVLPLLAEMAVDRPPSEPVEDDPAQELGIGALYLLGLLCDVPR